MTGGNKMAEQEGSGLFEVWCVIAIIIAGLCLSNLCYTAAIADLQSRVETLEAKQEGGEA